jgi:multidrug resistance efflux pump
MQLKAYEHIYLHNKKSNIQTWIFGFLLVLIITLFLPWTQTIRSSGNVTTLRQEQRPQQVNTIIAGSVVKWYVKEGDSVKAGDTLVQITEVKEDYLDPQLLQRTEEQLSAREQSIDFYNNKITATQSQIGALQNTLALKMDQLQNKLQQSMVKLQSDSIEATAAANDFNIATLQYNRQKALHDSGLVSLSQLEQRAQYYQQAQAKKVSAQNKYINTRQELSIIRIEMNAVQQEYAEKIAKAESDRYQSLSQQAGSRGDVAKLQNQYASYAIRKGMYYILAPQDGQVVQARKSGIGEVVKEGEMLVQIVPSLPQFAVEVFVRPVDLPLVLPGQKMQFLFDGFPAIVFSGWPNASYGTFSGVVTAVESSVSSNGKFRVLVQENPDDRPWPTALKIGTGARGLALLNEVPVWYELWRNINSFPPDFYQTEQQTKNKK